MDIDLHPSHGTTLGRREDGHRQNALVLAGWTVLRFDLADLMTRPDQVRETVARALANAAG
ncbi:MAG: endonuclease domain-containing protein [Actinobacteria bacterium]|nr:endonuclease domain-containing protein [Actinomycetota bacterium]